MSFPGVVPVLLYFPNLPFKLSVSLLFTSRQKHPRPESFAKRATASATRQQPSAGPLFGRERMHFASQGFGGLQTPGWHPWAAAIAIGTRPAASPWQPGLP